MDLGNLNHHHIQHCHPPAQNPVTLAERNDLVVRIHRCCKCCSFQDTALLSHASRNMERERTQWGLARIEKSPLSRTHRNETKQTALNLTVRT